MLCTTQSPKRRSSRSLFETGGNLLPHLAMRHSASRWTLSLLTTSVLTLSTGCRSVSSDEEGNAILESRDATNTPFDGGVGVSDNCSQSDWGIGEQYRRLGIGINFGNALDAPMEGGWGWGWG